MPNMARRFLEYFRLERKRAGSGLSVRELERWSKLKQEIEHHRQRAGPGQKKANSGPDQRRSARVPTRLHCSYASTSDFSDAIITNLSTGGVFISTSQPLPMGETLRLHLHVAGSEASIEVEAVVVSTNVGRHLDAESGMGLRFSRMSSEIVKEIQVLYEKELERQLEVQKGPGGRMRSTG